MLSGLLVQIWHLVASIKESTIAISPLAIAFNVLLSGAFTRRE
jgi:hypothetical protein